MTDIVLYTNPHSRGQIAHWLLEELGEPYDVEWLDYGDAMKSPEYLAINPMGKVPAVVYKGRAVTECAAICAFLAASHPDKGLIPAVGEPELADFYRWLFFAAGPVEQVMTVNSMGWEVPADRGRQLGFGSVSGALDALETALGGGAFVCGERFTAADVYLGSCLNWGMQFGTVEKRPAFEKYVKNLVDRPAMRRVRRISEARARETAR